MAVISFSRNLKLRISSDLTADAKYNLEKIDTLASLYQVDSTEAAKVRSKTSITLSPNNSDIGGSGSGGTINFGDSNQTVSEINFYSSALNINNAEIISTAAIKSSVGFSVTNNNFSVTLAPPSLSSNVTLTLPNSDGSPSQVLTTDGNGVLSWTSIAGNNIGLETTATWTSGEGTTKTINHNFNTRLVLVQVIDPSDNYRTIEVDNIERPTDNSVVINSSVSPQSSWIVLLKQIIT